MQRKDADSTVLVYSYWDYLQTVASGLISFDCPVPDHGNKGLQVFNAVS